MKPTITLSVRGRHTGSGGNRRFDWKNALADAAVMAALTFFTSLGGMGATGIPTLQSVVAAGIAAATQFFALLALKRGLVKEGGEGGGEG